MFYQRVGRLDLIQAVNVAMGDLFEPYCNNRHTEEDFKKALSYCLNQQLKLTPNDEIIIFCDNYSTHISESVVRLIAKLLGIKQSSLGIKNKKAFLKIKKPEWNSSLIKRIKFGSFLRLNTLPGLIL